MTAPIFLFTDFSLQGPYVGQMHSAVHAVFPQARVIDLMHDAPAMNPKASAYLLAATVQSLPEAATIVAVVDPGVGSERKALMVQADGRQLVGPDNGLLEIARRQSDQSQAFVLDWRPKEMSTSFHGRDLFAPAGASWAKDQRPASSPIQESDMIGGDWPNDLAEIIYIDGYGNAMTGIRARTLSTTANLTLPDGQSLTQATTFSDQAPGTGFWYANSQGLAEIAVNGGSAAAHFDLRIGSPIQV